MNKLLYILLLSFGFGAIFQVPEDYSTIQSGIDAAEDGDTILVSQGIYFENLIIEKSITLSSYAMYDDLLEWVDNFDEYYVTNDNISNTIINGSNNTNGEVFQSTILINSPEDGCIEPTIFGFTITGGSGTKLINGDRHGGGILTNNALPIINYNFIKNNGGDIQEGGGIGFDSGVDFSVNILNIKGHNLRCTGDADLSYNFYRDNDALYGNTLSTEGFEGSLDMSNNIYDVYDCPAQEATPVWVDIEEDVEVDFQYSAGDLCSITEDVWVSPDGDDYLNTGLTPESAFRTIKVALERIALQVDNPTTIFLTEGTFAPSITGESFPIIMVSNVNLIGRGEEVTILNSDVNQGGISGKIIMNDCNNNIISDLTITGPYGSGIYLMNSNPILNNLNITSNYSTNGGGMRVYYSNPILTNVIISNNSAVSSGGGMYLYYSDPILTNVVISNNLIVNAGTPGAFGGGILVYESNPIVTNSIIWGNSLSSIFIIYGEPVVNYSNIEDLPTGYGNWIGENNINNDPQFTDPGNSDYSLQLGSPCINSGNPNLWFEDLDGTRSDMGVLGGLFILPNFISYNFGEVGDISINKQFTLTNFRATPITITSATFGTTSFKTDTSFPMTIEPFKTGIVNIKAIDAGLGYIEDAMELISNDLPDGLSVSLTVNGSEDNILTGNLSGEYESATYHILGDLIIEDSDTVHLQAGTKFLFDSGVRFFIHGMLKAIGTESDSIIFDNYDEDRWSGFTLENVSEETTFEYVRISGAEKDDGGGMFLLNSSPTLTHVTISNNVAVEGGGMWLEDSNPTLSHVIISKNTANFGSGGMSLDFSNPILTNVTISNNTAGDGAGMTLYKSNPILTHVNIINNTAKNGGGIYLIGSNPTITHSNIINNTAEFGSGILLEFSSPTLNHVTISNNMAQYGGWIILYESNPILTHANIVNNIAGEESGMILIDSNPTITNSIIWDNIPESIFLENGDEEPIITYSDIEGGWIGEGNIDTDPQFTDSTNDNYTLQSSSPCINTGIIIGDIEYCGSAPDMGAFEYCDEECGAELADVSGDGQINVLDLVQIANYILEVTIPQFECAADYNEDGQVNILDLVQIANYILNN